jgi:hypothetical protein
LNHQEEKMDFTRRTMMAGSALLMAPQFISGAHAQQPAPNFTGPVDSRIGKIDLVMGLPANAQVEQRIYDEMDFQRACQAYIWALPIVGMNDLSSPTKGCSAAGPASWCFATPTKTSSAS